LCFEGVGVELADVDGQREIAAVDRLRPLRALAVRRRGRDGDLVLHGCGTEVDGQPPRREEVRRDLLSVDDHGDFRVLETGLDDDVDDAGGFAGVLAMGAALEDELRSGGCVRREEESENRGEK
jgi:hypothetical protein